jgi:hypothetical protein
VIVAPASDTVSLSQFRYRYHRCVHIALQGAAALHKQANGPSFTWALEGLSLAASVNKNPRKRDFPSLSEIGLISPPRPSFHHPLAIQHFSIVSISFSSDRSCYPPTIPIVYSRVVTQSISSPKPSPTALRCSRYRFGPIQFCPWTRSHWLPKVWRRSGLSLPQTSLGLSATLVGAPKAGIRYCEAIPRVAAQGKVPHKATQTQGRQAQTSALRSTGIEEELEGGAETVKFETRRLEDLGTGEQVSSVATGQTATAAATAATTI